MRDDDLITVRIEPIGGAKRNVGFETFVAELQAIHGALVRADRLISGGKTTRYEIVGLSMNSPANVVLFPQPLDKKTDRRERVVSGFFNGLAAIRKGNAPAEFDRPMLEKIRER